MRLLKDSRLYLRVAIVVAMACAGWVFADRYLGRTDWGHGRRAEQSRRDAEFDRIYGGTAVRILQFYSPAAPLIEGDSTTICYGVVNARSVRIEPPVDGVSVSLSRCVGISPEETTRYTLTAEGHDGRIVSESFVLEVRPDPATLPKITAFRITSHKVDHGRHVFSLAFTTQNAEEVFVEPRAFPTVHGAPYGRFYVVPEKTTTYTLHAVGKKGREVQQPLTVEVPD